VLLPLAYATIATLRAGGRLTWSGLAPLLIAGILAAVPVATYYLWARHLAITYPPHHFAGAGHWVWENGPANWLAQRYFLPELLQIVDTWTWTLPVAGLALIGLLIPPPAKGGMAPWLFHWWLAGFAIFYLIGAEELVGQPWNFQIATPAVAALGAHALLAFVRQLPAVGALRRRMAIAGILAVLGLVAWQGHERVQWLSHPYGRQSYLLGSALRAASTPGDLVVTIAHDIGDPTAIYYSDRRGWVFPPPDHQPSWIVLPGDDAELIGLLERLRGEGADWFGVVEEHHAEVWANRPAVAAYLARQCEPPTITPDYTICRLRPAE
jgi:hypothetical protein